jgi:hypothetical protein
MEFFVPARALRLDALMPGMHMGLQARLMDDGMTVESLYAPEFPVTAEPFTWGRVRFAAKKGESR